MGVGSRLEVSPTRGLLIWDTTAAEYASVALAGSSVCGCSWK